MQLVVPNAGVKSSQTNLKPVFKKLPSKKLIAPLSKEAWKNFSIATSSAVSAWILCATPKKNEKYDDVDLLIQKYLQKENEYRKLADLEHILKQCRFENGEYSSTAVNKLLESIDDKKEFINRLITLEELNLEKLDADCDYDLIDKFLDHSRIYKDPMAVAPTAASLQLIQTLSKTKDKRLINFVQKLINDTEITPVKMQNFLFMATKREKEFNKLYKAVMDDNYPNEFISIEGVPQEILTNKIIKDFNTMKSRALTYPDKYVNGNYADTELAKYEILDTFHLIGYHLPRFLNTFDKEAIDYIMRQRLNNFSSNVLKASLLSNEERTLVKNFQKALNQDGKPFLAKQKAEIFTLIQTHKENEIPLFEIKEVLSEKKVNLSKIYKRLFYCLLRQSGFNNNEIERVTFERLNDFDISKTHLILKSLRKDETSALKNLIWAMFNTNFREYVHSDFDIYGDYNNDTKDIFTKNRWDYDKWFNPDKSLEVNFTPSIEGDLTLNNLADEIEKGIELLRKTDAKNFIDKQLITYIEDDKFTIPKNLLNNKHFLLNLIQKIERQLEQVWKRARESSLSEQHFTSKNYSQKVLRAKATLNVLAELQNKKAFLYNYNPPEETVANFKIGMWGRNPAKDIFQGNYSNCCIGMGREQGQEIADYLLNTMFNMIEIKDTKTDEVIGNALIYFVKNENNEKRLIIDNIEINPTIKLSTNNGIRLRNAIFEYAHNIMKSVTKNQKIPVMLGAMHNDLPCDDLKRGNENVRFIGELSASCLYLDAFGGLWSCFEDDYSTMYYYKI